MKSELRDTGIAVVGEMPWGTHFCHFYETAHDLLDTVIPYLRSGLKDREQCLWVTAKPLDRKTRDSVRRAIPGIDEHVSAGDIRILPYSQWYLDKDGVFHARRVMAAWDQALERAIDKGYAGLRAVADEAWLGSKDWQAFADYEQQLDEPIARQRMIVMCAYPLRTCQGCAIFDVAHTHQFAIAERHGSWQTLETPELKHAKAELAQLNEELELRVVARTRDLEASNKALRRSQELLQAIIDNTTAVVSVKDLQGRYLLVNRRYEDLFHVDRATLVGRTDFDVFSPEQAEAFRAFDQQVLEAGTALEAEEVASHDDGLHSYISIKCPLFDGSGQPYAVCGISTDITERKRMENEHQARLAAEATSRAKDEFLANMSHELRSPLNTILGFTRLLERDPTQPEATRENLGLILKSGEHLHALINDVLDLAKLDAGRAMLNETDFDLDFLLDELKDLLTPAAIQKGLRLIFLPRPGLPHSVRSDPLKLRQILINLVNNAIKFTCQGSVTVRVEPLDTAVPGERPRLLFSVADTGPGIAPDELGNLFHSFAQARAGREAREGTGLGLAISRSLVRLMGGEMQLDSELGRGTTVSFDLPVQVAESLPVREDIVPRQVVGLAPGQLRNRILVVDDHAEARHLLVRLLAPFGFEVREAANGQEAIDLWRQWQPDLIWMDLRMPVLDGREATRRIRAEQREARPVIIALTASSFEEDRQDILASGCDDMLRKPFREAELVAALERHLMVRFSYQEVPPEPDAPRTPPLSAFLPDALRNQIEEAITQLDPEGIDEAIKAIRAIDAQFAQTLAASARDFRYDAILSMIKAVAQPTR